VSARSRPLTSIPEIHSVSEKEKLSMRILKRSSWAVILCVFCFGLMALAQAPVKVQRAELSINFGVAKGRLVAAGDLLIFLDEENPDASFALEKANIKSWNEQEGVITLDTGKAVKDRSGERTRFAFRLVDGNSAALAAWYKEAPLTRASDVAARDAAGAETALEKAGQKIYQARKKNFPFGTSDGKLVITERMILFEAANDRARSRQWDLKDIKNIKQTGPYVLEIESFTGDEYKLELLGDGMTPAEFKALSDRVVAARVK
jgi:hypothetical protein